MGLFSKKAPKAQSLQIPDELALKAADQGAAGNHLAALETYGEAIDKIHTMCVVAQPGSRIRQPGPQDQPILDGFNSALAGVVASSSDVAGISSTVERTAAYLHQIAGEAGPESGRYHSAINAIQAAYGR